MEPWTEREQELLEEGLVKFAVLCDVKEKWKAIAGHVKTRDVRACADRFKVCRQRALEQQAKEEEEVRQEPEVEANGDWRAGWSDEEWRQWNSWSESWKESPQDEGERRKWEMQQDIEAIVVIIHTFKENR